MLASLDLATAQVCVDNALAHTVGVTAPVNTGVAYSYQPILTLPAGNYRYTYNTSGGIPLQNFFLILNGNAWTPYSTTSIPNSPNTVTFNFHIPTAVPLCTSMTIGIRFQRQLSFGQFSTVGTFDLNIVVAEDGERKNLTFVNGAGKAYYAGTDYKAHVMTWNSSTSQWNYAALNVVPNWGAVQIAGQMANFADGSRIFFKGKDKKLYNLINQSGNNWTLSALSQNVAGLPNVTGNVGTRNNNEVIFYGADNKIHQLLLNGSTWSDQIVAPAAGWPSSVVLLDGESICLAPASTNIFFSHGRSVSQVYQNTSGGPWVFESIGSLNIPWPYHYDSDLLAVDNYAVYYKGRDNFIHRYTKCGNEWRLDAIPISAVSENNVVLYRGFLTKFPGEDRVYYKAATGRIYNLYNVNGVWFNYSLVNSMTSAAGDLIAAEGKIFFINHDKRAHNSYWQNSAWSDVPLATGAPANAKGCIFPYY
jgi:hypothetical protein